MEVSVVPLHHHKQYLPQCCKLINDEWKRSETARMHSLESSSDQLPTNLILIQNEQVIGHVKLSPIPSLHDSCFIESVVIEKELRGLGFGTLLMEKTEDYCINCLKLKTIYLSTKGQEGFYAKLGYHECPPVSIYGSYTPKTNSSVIIAHDKNPNKSNESTVQVPKPPPLPHNNITTNIKTYMKKQLVN